ncbi:hypothetical protein ACQKM2_26600 [Streptomyces sp. NPDC004126]|uniref:hypothetical protein n=1 Tax=Streptomyces sp. NPDC004126 TaxID=3390695 RepID=UPI003D024E98
MLTAARHISLISHLIDRFSDDAVHRAKQACEVPALPWDQVEALTTAAVPLTRTLSHYTQALIPLTALTRPGQPQSMRSVLHRIELQSTLHTHLAAAHRALAETRTALGKPGPNTPPPAPPAC